MGFLRGLQDFTGGFAEGATAAMPQAFATAARAKEQQKQREFQEEKLEEEREYQRGQLDIQRMYNLLDTATTVEGVNQQIDQVTGLTGTGGFTPEVSDQLLAYGMSRKGEVEGQWISSQRQRYLTSQEKALADGNPEQASVYARMAQGVAELGRDFDHGQYEEDLLQAIEMGKARDRSSAMKTALAVKTFETAYNNMFSPTLSAAERQMWGDEAVRINQDYNLGHGDMLRRGPNLPVPSGVTPLENMKMVAELLPYFLDSNKTLDDLTPAETAALYQKMNQFLAAGRMKPPDSQGGLSPDLDAAVAAQVASLQNSSRDNQIQAVKLLVTSGDRDKIKIGEAIQRELGISAAELTKSQVSQVGTDGPWRKEVSEAVGGAQHWAGGHLFDLIGPRGHGERIASMPSEAWDRLGETFGGWAKGVGATGKPKG